MKTVCTRCKNTIIYESELPKKCPFCGAEYLYSPKSEEEQKKDEERVKLPDNLKSISPASAKRKPLVILSVLIDILWIVAGVYCALKFYRFPRLIMPVMPYVGIVLTLGSIYRLIYRAVMFARLSRLVKKEQITSVDALVTLLAYKTRSDVLVLFKKAVRWGFLTGYGVSGGVRIYKK